MLLNSIPRLVGLRRDQDHDRTELLYAALGQFSRSMEKQGEQPLNMRAVREAAEPESHETVPATEAAVARYLDALPESERTMLKMWHQGMNVQQIAKRTKTRPTSVAKSFARIYADLRVLYRHHQPEEARA